MRRLLLATALASTLACAYLLPASWRAFRVEPDDAPPAITRALDARELTVESWNQETDEIRTDWLLFNDVMEQSRERFVVRWEHNPRDSTLTVYVRHEAQDRDAAVGGDWSSTYHDSSKELALLDAITKELEATQAPLPPSP